MSARLLAGPGRDRRARRDRAGAKDGVSATRYVRLWSELLLLCARQMPGLTAAMIAIMLLGTVVPAAIALALRAAVDATVRGQAAPAIAGTAVVGLAYATLNTIGNVAGGLRTQLVERIGLTELDARLLSDVCGIEGLGHLEHTDYLDRVTVLRNSAWGVMDSAWRATESVCNVIRLGLTLLLLGTVSPLLLALLAFAVAPLWLDRYGKLAVSRAEKDSGEAMRTQRHLFTLATSAASGKEIRVNSAGEELARLQAAAWDEAAGLRYHAQLVAAGWRAAGWLVFTLGFVGGLAVVVYRVAHGHGTLGDVVLAITVSASVRSAVQDTVQRSSALAGYSRLLGPFLWLRDYARREDARPAGTIAAPTVLHDALVLDRITYTYPGTSRRAVDEVTVRIPAGSVVAVVGEYGSGKTTLVKLLCKFYRPDQGSVSADGTTLDEFDTASWRAGTSVMFQDFGRYHITLREAVALGDIAGADDEGRLRAAVRAAAADELVARLPDGLASQLGREFGGTELSEGEWQKTGLARACMRPWPVLLVLDEPTASLDAPSEHAIFEQHMARARDLARRAGTITLIVSHRFSTVAGADMILVMAAGKLVEYGSHDDLMAVGGRYAALYGLQAAAYSR